MAERTTPEEDSINAAPVLPVPCRTSPVALRTLLAAAAVASATLSPTSFAPVIAPCMVPSAALAMSPATSDVPLITLLAVILMASSASTPVSLVPRRFRLPLPLQPTPRRRRHRLLHGSPRDPHLKRRRSVTCLPHLSL